MLRVGVLLALLLGAVMLTTPAGAAPPVCGDRSTVLKSLSTKYSEQPVAAGVASNGGVIEILKGPDGKTWSILFTYPDGPSCLIATGEAWQEIAYTLNGPKA
ncbi:hypothetical protein CSC3H3_04830 [Thalassospira marina]|uniref:Uncharacterized protein n=2 Tax=Thalassospira marina TaxID=2048283 RepID=A0A2N3L0A7_9PROT|nr:hypothetical protein CSC3H3_04830 [Thalassospira marina]PKR56233.1 hypothetical protein COO20_02220 [Thalassospira marina]